MFWVVNDVGKLSGSLECGGSSPGKRFSSNASTIKKGLAHNAPRKDCSQVYDTRDTLSSLRDSMVRCRALDGREQRAQRALSRLDRLSKTHFGTSKRD